MFETLKWLPPEPWASHRQPNIMRHLPSTHPWWEDNDGSGAIGPAAVRCRRERLGRELHVTGICWSAGALMLALREPVGDLKNDDRAYLKP